MPRPVKYLLVVLLVVQSASAQFYYFGRNKVQYTRFDWKVLKTEHFDIYYYAEMKDLAERGATFAEESYRSHEQRFNFNIGHRIPLVFYSSHLHFEQTNIASGFIPEGIGGFFEFVKGRVVIPYDGSMHRFEHVIRHELVHVFMHSKINRVLLDHRITQDRTPPLWFTEGLAEFWSSAWDTQAEMVLRDAVLSNYLVPLSEMDRIYGSFLMYKEGQNILEFIAQRYGPEKILLLMENFWKASTFNEVMKLTIGKNYKEFDDDWTYALKKRYYPVLREDDMPSGVTKSLVESGFNSKPLFFKRDSTRELYFVGNHTGYSSIYRINLDKEKPEPELVVQGENTPEYEAFHLLQNKLDISRDGIMAFVTKSGETDVLHLYDLKADKLQETIRFRELVVLGSPSWSPDGKKIAISAVDMSGKSDLYIFDLATRALKQLTNDIYEDRDPAWSPDGSTIVFSSDRDADGKQGYLNLFSYDLATAEIEYVTIGTANYTSPAWSPDGKLLMFTSDIDGAQNVWMMEMNRQRTERTMKKITHLSTAAFDPAWTDKDEMIFTAFENFSFQIKKVRNLSTVLSEANNSRSFQYDVAKEQWDAPKVNASSVVGEYRYNKEYRLDLAQSQISTDPIFGTTGGAAIAMSDVLGNDQYYFLIYNTAQARSEFLSSFNIAMSHVSLGRRTNYDYGIFHFAGDRYDLTDPNLFYYERAFGGYFVLSYPLSMFQRIETELTVSNSDKDNYVETIPRKAVLVSSSFSFTADNSLWGPTGPMDGSRARLTLAYTTDIRYSNVNYYTILADYRNYWRLSTRSALASRINLWYNDGKEARRFFMGGSWDLRGWPRWEIRGQKIWFASEELRFPFVDQIGVKFPFGGLSFSSIRGAIYTDVGGAWDTKYDQTLGSVGTGIRINLGGILVLRYDIGKRIENNLAKFQKGLFYQFFFGWDF
ncbi:MAG TPA: BamA/TamA family outer membrane protein [Bacteroidota bacterium]|nr:BamA/TamA family outer membrane protein [Bacteroidota bacterium]